MTLIATNAVKNRSDVKMFPMPKQTESKNLQKKRLNNDVLKVNELPPQDKNPVKPKRINDEEPLWGIKTSTDRSRVD